MTRKVKTMNEFKKGDLVRVTKRTGRYAGQEGTVVYHCEGYVNVSLRSGPVSFLPEDLEIFDPAPSRKIRADRMVTGIVVLDNLEWEFENGTDEDYLKAVEEFCEVGERLPRGAFLSVKYARRLVAIADQAREGK
jgi:hypothetical protein